MKAITFVLCICLLALTGCIRTVQHGEINMKPVRVINTDARIEIVLAAEAKDDQRAKKLAKQGQWLEAAELHKAQILSYEKWAEGETGKSRKVFLKKAAFHAKKGRKCYLQAGKSEEAQEMHLRRFIIIDSLKRRGHDDPASFFD